MRSRSKRMARIYVERRRIVEEQLTLYPVCERCGTQPSSDVHEMVGRGRGGSILDRANLRCLCRRCHDIVTQNPAQGEAEGFIKPSGSMRHPFTSAEGYYCDVCSLPRMNQRHREDAA
jgi:hypothetical protein